MYFERQEQGSQLCAQHCLYVRINLRLQQSVSLVADEQEQHATAADLHRA